MEWERNTSSLQPNHPLVIILYLPIATMSDISLCCLFTHSNYTAVWEVNENSDCENHVKTSTRRALFTHSINTFMCCLFEGFPRGKWANLLTEGKLLFIGLEFTNNNKKKTPIINLLVDCFWRGQNFPFNWDKVNNRLLRKGFEYRY